MVGSYDSYKQSSVAASWLSEPTCWTGHSTFVDQLYEMNPLTSSATTQDLHPSCTFRPPLSPDPGTSSIDTKDSWLIGMKKEVLAKTTSPPTLLSLLYLHTLLPQDVPGTRMRNGLHGWNTILSYGHRPQTRDADYHRIEPTLSTAAAHSLIVR